MGRAQRHSRWSGATADARNTRGRFVPRGGVSLVAHGDIGCANTHGVALATARRLDSCADRRVRGIGRRVWRISLWRRHSCRRGTRHGRSRGGDAWIVSKTGRCRVDSVFERDALFARRPASFSAPAHRILKPDWMKSTHAQDPYSLDNPRRSQSALLHSLGRSTKTQTPRSSRIQQSRTQQMLSNPAMAARIQQMVQTSGLSPDQIRERLETAGAVQRICRSIPVRRSGRYDGRAGGRRLRGGARAGHRRFHRGQVAQHARTHAATRAARFYALPRHAAAGDPKRHDRRRDSDPVAVARPAAAIGGQRIQDLWPGAVFRCDDAVRREHLERCRRQLSVRARRSARPLMPHRRHREGVPASGDAGRIRRDPRCGRGQRRGPGKRAAARGRAVHEPAACPRGGSKARA